MRRFLLAPLLATLLVLASAAAAQATTIMITTTDDPAGAGDCLTTDASCSLRQAINAENGTASGGDTITLGTGTYSLTQGTNLDITRPVTLAGNGAALTTIDGSQNTTNNLPSRILRVDGVAVTIQDLKFTGGDDGADEGPCCNTLNQNGGGALWNDGGSVDIRRVAFANNPGGLVGGGVSNTGGSLTMTDVSFTNDQASIGGALFTHSGEITGTGVTFEHNATGATDAAAVYLLGGSVSFTNTTVVGSGGASSRGGGIHNAGASLTLTSATLSDNIRGSLETDEGATTTVTNTIIANGFSDGDGDCVAAGLLSNGSAQTSNAITTDHGGNLDQDDSCGLTAANGDQPGVDPKLASLADNGGPTPTEALVFGSPAFGAGNVGNCPEVDQRGETRATPCDIGAFEAQFTEEQPTALTSPAANIGQTQADLRADIDFRGEAGGLHFLWGTASDALTNVTNEAGEGVIDGATIRSQTLQDLSPGTTYFYKAVADNATGSATSSTVQQFTTDPGPPVVSDISLGQTTDTTAVIDFSIDPQGSDTTYIVEYGPDTNYGQHTDPIDIGSAVGAQSLGATLTNLTPGITYHVNVVATNDVQSDVASGDTTLTTDRQLQGTAGTPLELDDSNDQAFSCPTQAHITWGDSTESDVAAQCTPGDDETPSVYSLTTSHTYGSPGHYQILVSYDNGDVSNLFAQIAAAQGPANPPPNSNQPPPAPPIVSGGGPTTKSGTGASVSGAVNPEGSPTQVFFQYGLDLSQRGPGASTTLYDRSTSSQLVGSDSSAHTVTASLTGLIPGALYHVRLVAVNAADTTFGQDQTFTAAVAPSPPPPVLGQSEDVKPVSGTVFIRTRSGQFIPLTGATQIPTGTVIDALHGSLQLLAALGKGKTDHGIFGGAVFRVTQSRNGLTTLSLIEGLFKGGPTYAICKAHKTNDATIASSKTLQLLKASAHGKFSTKGRYSAATVRGTKWTVADRCDGTLTHDITDSVAVTDFVHHKTIILHAGQSYLALAKPPHKRR